MVKFGYKYYRESRWLRYIIACSIILIIVNAPIISVDGFSRSIFEITIMFLILGGFCCTILELFERLDDKSDRKKDVATDEERCISVIEDTLVFIGLVKAKVVWGIKFGYVGRVKAIRYYIGYIDLKKIKRIVLKGEKVLLYYSDTTIILRIRLDGYCTSPYKLARQIAANADKYGIDFSIKDKNRSKVFSSLDYFHNLDSFILYDKNGEVFEEDGITYSEEQGAEFINVTANNIKSRKRRM